MPEEFLDFRLDDPKRSALQALRRTILEIVPDTEE
jgi:hypothetical protein